MLHVRRGNVEGTRETKTERDRTSDGTGYKIVFDPTQEGGGGC